MCMGRVEQMNTDGTNIRSGQGNKNAHVIFERLEGQVKLDTFGKMLIVEGVPQ